MREQVVGAIVLLIAVFMLITCLILMVKILRMLLQEHLAVAVKKTINSNFPGKFACLTGYFAILVGAILTMLVQSSSVVASALTPLVGLGVVTVDRVFPMMLGANIGTTSTAILASFAATGARIIPSFQIALCHLFFNLSGILIWYPIPKMRKVPVAIATFLGNTTAQYRWFAFLLLFLDFFLVPLLILGLSIAGWQYLVAVLVPVFLLLIAIGVLNLLQKYKPHWLPEKLRTWEFLPEWMRSLAPLDRYVQKMLSLCSCCACCDNIANNKDKDNESESSGMGSVEMEKLTIQNNQDSCNV